MQSLQTLSSLSCVKNVSDRFPASMSLHSVDLLPVETDPGLMTITLRRSGEIRLVHGGEEVRKIIKEVVEGFVKEKEENDVKISVKAGVWILTLPGGLKLQSSTGVKFCSQLLERLIRQGWEPLTSSDLTITPGYELVTWILKKCSTPLHNCEVTAIVFDEDNKVLVSGHNPQVQVNNVVSRSIKKFMKEDRRRSDDEGESKDTTEDTTTPKSRPSSRGDVDGDGDGGELLGEIEKELKSSRENLEEKEKEGEKEEVKKEEDKPMTEKKEENKHMNEKKEEKMENKPMKDKRAAIGKLFGCTKGTFKDVRDDPKCPNAFELELNLWTSGRKEDKTRAVDLVLEIVHLMFCRQWKLIANANLFGGKKNDVLFFCRDGRILPALGQQSFGVLELQKPNLIRLHNVPEDVEAAVKAVLLDKWPPGLESDQPDRVRRSTQFVCSEAPWEKTSDETTSSHSRILTTHLIGTMNDNSFNMYGTIHLFRGERQSCCLIFRHSNVTYSEALCLHLSGLNRLCLLGGSDQEIETVRSTLEKRWPYPITQDRVLQDGKTEMGWLFKLRRYPWAVSYGNRHVDRVLVTAKGIIEQHRIAQIKIPQPKNSDTESGKSLIIFILKALSELGWRLVSSADVCSKVLQPENSNREQTHSSDPYSLFLMR